MKGYSPTPDPYEVLARELRARGINTSADRLEDRAAALHDRRRLDEKADVERVRDLALTVKKARRALEVAQTMWQLSSTQANLRAVTEAMAARREAEKILREELLNDDELVSAAIRWVG
jgi:hypothetical protein